MGPDMDGETDAVRPVRGLTLADLEGRRAVVGASDPRVNGHDHEVLVETVSRSGFYAFLRPVAADGSLRFGYWVGVRQYRVVRVVKSEVVNGEG